MLVKEKENYEVSDTHHRSSIHFKGKPAAAQQIRFKLTAIVMQVLGAALAVFMH